MPGTLKWSINISYCDFTNTLSYYSSNAIIPLLPSCYYWVYQHIILQLACPHPHLTMFYTQCCRSIYIDLSHFFKSKLLLINRYVVSSYIFLCFGHYRQCFKKYPENIFNLAEESQSNFLKSQVYRGVIYKQ